MTQAEALKSAIEFAEYCLEELDLSYMASNQAKRLVEKAKEALAQQCVCGEPNSAGTHRTDGPCLAPQPEQEPVAWATQMGEYAHIKWGAKRPEYPMVYEVPLYTTPPQRT